MERSAIDCLKDSPKGGSGGCHQPLGEVFPRSRWKAFGLGRRRGRRFPGAGPGRAGDGGEDGAAGGGEARMVIADEDLEAAETALLEAHEAVAPADLSFAEP